jgi:hypothetical protein
MVRNLKLIKKAKSFKKKLFLIICQKEKLIRAHCKYANQELPGYVQSYDEIVLNESKYFGYHWFSFSQKGLQLNKCETD